MTIFKFRGKIITTKPTFDRIKNLNQLGSRGGTRYQKRDNYPSLYHMLLIILSYSTH